MSTFLQGFALVLLIVYALVVLFLAGMLLRVLHRGPADRVDEVLRRSGGRCRR